MRIRIVTRGVRATDSLKARLFRRLHFALSRYGDAFAEVQVRLEDVNGPRGGPDKRCRMTLEGRRFEPLSVEEVHTDIGAAADLAAERLERAARRRVDRSRDFRPRSASGLPS